MIKLALIVWGIDLLINILKDVQLILPKVLELSLLPHRESLECFKMLLCEGIQQIIWSSKAAIHIRYHSETSSFKCKAPLKPVKRQDLKVCSHIWKRNPSVRIGGGSVKARAVSHVENVMKCMGHPFQPCLYSSVWNSCSSFYISFSVGNYFPNICSEAQILFYYFKNTR